MSCPGFQFIALAFNMNASILERPVLSVADTAGHCALGDGNAIEARGTFGTAEP